MCNIEEAACDARRGGGDATVARCRRTRRAHANFSVSTSCEKLRRNNIRIMRRSDEEANEEEADERVVVGRLSRALVTSRKSGPFLLCNFNNHILQPLDKMAGQDRRRGPPRFVGPLPKGDSRCTFLGALRHLDLAARSRRRPITYRRRLMRSK